MRSILSKVIIYVFLIMCPLFLKGHNVYIDLPVIEKKKKSINPEAVVFIRTIDILEQSMATGSGTILYSDQYKSIVVTAGHVCYPRWDGNLQNSKNFIGDITTFRGKSYFYELIGIDGIHDICLIHISAPLKINTQLAISMPDVNSKVYVSGYPLGIFNIGYSPMFYGFYAGRIGFDVVFSLPAIGGLSGGGIYNEYGDLIGVLTKTLVEFNHLSFGGDVNSINGLVYVCIKKMGTAEYIYCPPTTQQSIP